MIDMFCIDRVETERVMAPNAYVFKIKIIPTEEDDKNEERREINQNNAKLKNK